MWTPRRIALALVGLLIFAAGYVTYARLLGSFDGLPPLPEAYKIGSVVQRPATSPSEGSSTDRKIKRAFGDNCAELSYPIKLEMKKHGIVLCARDYKIIKDGPRDGWMEMAPLSVAAFSERRGEDALEEINSIYCDVAYLRFEKPIRSMSDFNGRKIEAAELHADPEAQLRDPRKGRVRLLNNRRTADLNDDIEMITPGPVYYEDEPRPGRPHIYTFTEVQVTDHSNTPLAEPDRTVPRTPTMVGVGLRVFLSREPKDKQGSKTVVAKPAKAKSDTRQPITGVETVGLDHSVEMNLWTDSDSSFASPGTKTADKKKPAVGAKKDGPPAEKRLVQIRTNGPFRYDMNQNTAHFEKPATQKQGLVEHVTVTRSGKTGGQDLLDCEYLDVQFLRKRDAAKAKTPATKLEKKDESGSDGDMEIKSIRAWGDTVVMSSDAENLNATGSELVHDAEAHITILKGSPTQEVQVVKEGNLLRGSELHLFGDGKQISQAHILGAGSIGLGELDPKTREYQRQAFWTDRLIYTRQEEKDKPPLDVFTFIGKDGTRAIFRDTSGDKLQQLEGQQLKVWIRPADKDKDKEKDKKAVARKPAAKKGNTTNEAGAGRILRLEGTGLVRSTTPEMIIRHTDYLNVWFQDVPKLIKPPKANDKDVPKPAVGPAPREVPAKDPAAKAPSMPPETKGPAAKAGEPKKEQPKEKMPLIITAKKIETWINRDPEGQTEFDHAQAKGDVEAHQDPETKDKQGLDVGGQIVEVQAYAEGNRMVVFGDSSDMTKPKWGVVRFDKLTLFGFDIVIDQRNDTSVVKGEGSMEILSNSSTEGKKIEQPTTMHIYWKHRMDFFGADKLIYYHGGVQAYQKESSCKCEWMQVLLDRPVYLDQDRRAKAKASAAVKPGVKDKDGGKGKDSAGDLQFDDNAKIDTVLCFHAPKDESVPKPKVLQPVTLIDEVKENGKVIKFNSIQAPDVVIVNTPLSNEKWRRDITALATQTAPGVARIYQAGAKDLDEKTDGKRDAKDKKEAPERKAGELKPNEEMKLTVVQFGEKMWAEDSRKRAKFWTNVRVVHLAADRPNMPVDLREGEIPKGAVYLECRDTLEVFSTTQREKDKDGKEVDVSYQEMIAIGNVRVRKQGEFFGDADTVTYSELKGTLTFHGTLKNPAVINQVRGQGIPSKSYTGRTLTYFVKSKTIGGADAMQIKD